MQFCVKPGQAGRRFECGPAVVALVAELQDLRTTFQQRFGEEKRITPSA